MQVQTGLSKWSGRVPPLDLADVTVCPRETERRWHKIQPTPTSRRHIERIGIDGLPIDPRDWTRSDVWKWLAKLAVLEGLQPTQELVHKFPMNGKALCLMSIEMYVSRVPGWGKILFKDFQMRLGKAIHLS